MKVLQTKTWFPIVGCLLLLLIITACTVDERAAENPSNSGNTVRAEVQDANSDSMVSGPRIVFETTTYDFGEQVSGIDLERTFTFTNEGDSDLVIERVRAG
jgi:hypothetical protein